MDNEREKVVAYFVSTPNENLFDFYDEINFHCEHHNYDLVAIFHDINKSESDYLSTWDMLISFLLINKDIKQVLLPYSNNEIVFDGYDRLSDMQEFIDLPCATSWRIVEDRWEDEPYWWDNDEETENNDGVEYKYRTNGLILGISEDEIPF
jgi:hypothetical protein